MNLKLNLEGMKRVVAGHPWVRRQDLSRGGGAPPPLGGRFRLQDATGNFLAHALCDGPGKEPLLRVLSRERHAVLDEAWVALRLEWALDWRAGQRPGPALRLVHGEADSLPGVFVDFAGGALMLEIQSPAMEAFSEVLAKELQARLKPASLWKKAGGRWACLEGARAFKLEAQLGGRSFWLRLDEEQPWDFDLEGAAERDRLSQWKDRIQGREALSLFSRGGAWAAAALGLGASSALMVDQDFRWLERAAESLALSRLKAEGLNADAFKAVDRLLAAGRRFGLLAMDCPAQAKSPAGRFKTQADWSKAVKRAAPLLAPGGILALRLRGDGLEFRALEKALDEAGLELLAGAAPGPGFRPMPAWPEGLPGLQVAAAKRSA